MSLVLTLVANPTELLTDVKPVNLLVFLVVLLFTVGLSFFKFYLFSYLKHRSTPPSPHRYTMLNRLFVAVLLFSWTLASHYYLHNHFLEETFPKVLERILHSLYLLSVAILVYGLLPDLVGVGRKGMTRLGKKEAKSLSHLFLFLLQLLTFLTAVAGILEVWKINFTALITGLGIGSVAIALSAQSLLSNLIAGLTIMLDSPFQTGDFITVSGLSGTVEQIGWRSTRMRTRDQELVSMPNSKLMDANIVNVSRQRKRRLNFLFQVRSSATAEEIEAFLQEARQLVEQRAHYLKKDGVNAFVDSMEMNAYHIRLYYYMRETDYVIYTQERSEAFIALSRLLEERGFELISGLESHLQTKVQ